MQNFWSKDLEASKYFYASHLAIPLNLQIVSWFQNEILPT